MLNETSLLKKYESIYKKIKLNFSETETFYLVNNALIFSYFCKCDELSFNELNYEKCYKSIIDKHGTELFFHNIKKTSEYKDNLIYAIIEFINEFEQFSNETIEKTLGIILEKHINQKETGSYYTPSDTTHYMTWNAILMSIINKCDKDLKGKIYSTLKIKKTGEILNLKEDAEKIFINIAKSTSKEEKESLLKVIYSLSIIDPTCGSGAFIISAYECMTNYINKISKTIEYKKVLNCLYGLDLSEEAVKLTKIRLIIKTAKSAVASKELDELFARNFKCEDAFIGSDYVISEPGFDWKSFGTKFDCVIGNPPYVETKKYVGESYATKKCGNLYAHAIERTCNIVNEGSIITLIVPLSLVSTSRMKDAKDYLEKKSNSVYYATFADRPGCIFTGVHQRLVIFFSESGTNGCKVFTSSYKYWYNEERKNLFNNLTYVSNPFKDEMPKIGNEIELKIYNKLTQNWNNIFDLISKEETEHKLYLSTRIGFWAKAFDNNVFSSNEYKEYSCVDEDSKNILLAILNSSTFYFLWVMNSDCWHITEKNLSKLCFNASEFTQDRIERLSKLVNELMLDLEKNKKYIGSKQTDYEYKHKYSKNIIDKIDDELSIVFGLTKNELAYIESFTEKYRMNRMEKDTNMRVIDLFAGVGGMSEGFRKAGYKVILANEIDKSISESYVKNHPETEMINDDIKNILPIIKEKKLDVDVIIGGPPCQGFSMAGARIRANKSEQFLNDPRNFLFRHYFSIVQETEPQFFVMENVPGMLSMSNGEIIKEIENIFSNDNNFKNGRYYLYKKILNAHDYGVPQERHRLVIIGSKKDIDFEKILEVTRLEMIETGEISQRTIEDAISDLNWLESGEGSFEQEYRIDSLTDYQKERRKGSKKLYNHIATNHNEVALSRMRELKQGGRRLDLKDGERIKSVHSGAYGRMRWDEPSKTIITRFDTPSSGVYVHPERTRTITAREAARIQSFDDNFVFYGNKTSINKQIGNAVPPLLAYYLAKVIKKASEYYDNETISK